MRRCYHRNRFAADNCCASQNDTWEAHPLPSPASAEQLLEIAYNQILSIASNPAFGNDTCSRCLAGLEIGKFVALTAPEQGSALVVRVCEYFNFTSTGDCGGYYGQYSLGPDIVQTLALSDVGGYDGLVRTIWAGSTYGSQSTRPPART